MTHDNQNSPVNLFGIRKETQPNAVHRRIAPALVEESSSAVQMLEVGLVLW